MIFNSSSNKGFTLVEIMIVIAIIGVLSAVLFPSVTRYLVNSRDTSRIIALGNIKKAILNSYTENGVYPTPESGCVPSTLSPKYIATIPTSPAGSTYDEGCGPNGRYGYSISTNFSTPAYMLIANMEGEKNGNYTGSTSGMTGTLTASGYQTAVESTQKGAGDIYAIFDGPSSSAIFGSSTSTSAMIPPPSIPVNGSCSPSGCSAGSVTGLSGPACGGTQTWTCSGTNGGASSTTCSAATPACATYTITWGANGGTLTSAATTTVAQPNALGTLPSNPTRSGYSFSGWYTAPSGGELVTVSTIPTGNTTYSAQWKASPYAVCTAAGQTYTATTTYPGCNEADKIVCTGTSVGYTWAMCNVGSTTAGTTSASYGSYFQWGRNVPFPTSGSVTTVAGPLTASAASATTDFIINGSTAPYDWLIPQDGNLWGDTTNTSLARKGPCQDGYHVPSYAEMTDMKNALPGGVWMTTLKAPIAGYRHYADGSLGGAHGFWWTTLPGQYLYGDSTYTYLGGNSRALGFSVRCIGN